RSPTAGRAGTHGPRWRCSRRPWARSASTARRSATTSRRTSTRRSSVRCASTAARTSPRPAPSGNGRRASSRSSGRNGWRRRSCCCPSPTGSDPPPRTARGPPSGEAAMSATAWFELLASGLITGGVYALVALGLNLQYGLMRILNIAHGEFLMLGAFVTWLAHTRYGISPLAMAPLAFVVMMLVGFAVHRLCFARLARISPNVDVFEARGLMVAFGLMFLVQNFASLVWGGDLRGYDYLTEPVRMGGAQFAANKLVLLAVALAASIALIVLLRRTLLGKGVRALMQSPVGALLVGIDTARLHPLMFGIGLGLSGLAGSLLSMTYAI